MRQDEPREIAQRKQDVAGVFSRAAPIYDRVGPRFFSFFGRRLVELARLPSGARVLDVATGRGAVLFPAAEAVGPQGHVVGIDLSETMVEETRQDLMRGGVPNAEVHPMDAEYLRFSDESFDYVLCGFSIFFFPQLYRALSEFRRVLRPHGRIAVTTFDELFQKQWNWLYELLEAYVPPEPEVNKAAQSPSPKQPVFDKADGLEEIMKAAGFTDVQVVSEAREFTYTHEEEWWSTLWSHGLRRGLERLERAKGSGGLRSFKADAFEMIQGMKGVDGIHDLIPVLFTLATKPPA